MKFKIAVISLLAATMMICGYTGYRLVQEAEKQTEIQIIQTKINYIASSKIIEESNDLSATKETYLAEIEIEYKNLVKLVGPKKGIVGIKHYEN